MSGRAGQKRSRADPRSRLRGARLVSTDAVEPSADAAQAAASLLARKWVLPVLGALAGGPLRRFHIGVKVTGISPKVLTETLRLLEREGLVDRVLARESDVTVGIAYELTPLGRSLDQPVAALARWYSLHRESGTPTTRQDRLGA